MNFLREIFEVYLQYGTFLKNLMHTLTKEMTNKASMFKMRLITEQRVFVVKTYYKSKRYL